MMDAAILCLRMCRRLSLVRVSVAAWQWVSEFEQRYQACVSVVLQASGLVSSIGCCGMALQ